MRSILRVEHDKDRPYLTVSKETVRDRALPFDARGFLMFLLAKSDDWEIRPEALAKECGLSKPTVYRLLNKLIDGKYVLRDDLRRRRPDGCFERACLYRVFETKSLLKAFEMTEKECKELDNVPF